jgi:hypothetical protein
MSLSNQVKESVTQAASNLREALAFAARTEHPVIISNITDMLIRLESLDHVEEIMEKFGKTHDIPTSFH